LPGENVHSVGDPIDDLDDFGILEYLVRILIEKGDFNLRHSGWI
jgi:hypothetical protein